MKQYWQSILITLGIILAAAFLLQANFDPAGAQETADTPSQRTVSVSGTGQAEIRPDMAVIRLGVQTDAEQAADALSQNSQQMQAVIETLQEAGVAAEDIQTQQVQLQPRYQEPQPGPQQARGELAGYSATNIVQVQVRNLDNLGQLLDTAVQAGGNRIEGIHFEVSDPGEAVEQARTAAWEDAQAKAEQLVDLAGAELGVAWSIREFTNIPRPAGRGGPMMEAAAAAPPVEPGSQTIEVRLEVTWLLQ